MPKRSRAPNCTHLDMDRVYGRHQQCHVCGRSPEIGFLYECRQDWDTQSLRDIIMGEHGEDRVVVKSDMRLELQWLGLSESVIHAAEQGHYSRAQLDILKTQKKELQQTIADSLQASHTIDAAARLAALAQSPSSHDGALESALGRDAGPPACVLKACHGCRPYFRDRVYISFQSVLDADFPPMTREDADRLPTKSANIMRTIGNARRTFQSFSTSASAPLSLPTSTSLGASTDAPPTASTCPSTASDLTFQTTQTDLDAISAQRRPRRRFYKMGHRNSSDIARDLSHQSNRLSRQGLKYALQGIFRPNRDSSSEGSNITLPVPRTGTVRSSSEAEDIGDFDLPALRKVRKEKERMDVKNGTSAITYENASVVPVSNDSNYSRNTYGAHGYSTSDDSTMYSCLSRGSEVEVEGGVALTEEAVETHTPDILAIDVSQMSDAKMMLDVEMEDDDEAEADGGVYSIMSQV